MFWDIHLIGAGSESPCSNLRTEVLSSVSIDGVDQKKTTIRFQFHQQQEHRLAEDPSLSENHIALAQRRRESIS